MTDSADGPNVSINGPKDLLHGVGGTSDSKVKQEGMDHIKEKLGKRSTTDTASADGAQPLSTNPGSEDARGGISAGSGGVSSAAHVASPVGSGDDGVSQQQTTGGGLVETVKGYLGLGGGESEKSRGDDVAANDQTSTSGDPATKAVDAAAGSRTGTNPGSSEMASDNAGENKPNDGEQAHDGPRGDDSKGDSNQEGEKSKVEKKTGKQMENKDAIPTAGGEKLGEKHWGESKIIPDNPKPPPEEGTASADGQPDDKTRDNTKKNAGHGGDSSGGDEKMMDKVKDKLHIGHKEKS